MDIERLLRERIREAFEATFEGRTARPTNVAAAANADESGQVTSVYSDARVTIIQRDGTTEVIRHDEDDHREAHEEER